MNKYFWRPSPRSLCKTAQGQRVPVHNCDTHFPDWLEVQNKTKLKATHEWSFVPYPLGRIQWPQAPASLTAPYTRAQAVRQNACLTRRATDACCCGSGREVSWENKERKCQQGSRVGKTRNKDLPSERCLSKTCRQMSWEQQQSNVKACSERALRAEAGPRS